MTKFDEQLNKLKLSWQTQDEISAPPQLASSVLRELRKDASLLDLSTLYFPRAAFLSCALALLACVTFQKVWNDPTDRDLSLFFSADASPMDDPGLDENSEIIDDLNLEEA